MIVRHWMKDSDTLKKAQLQFDQQNHIIARNREEIASPEISEFLIKHAVAKLVCVCATLGCRARQRAAGECRWSECHCLHVSQPVVHFLDGCWIFFSDFLWETLHTMRRSKRSAGRRCAGKRSAGKRVSKHRQRSPRSYRTYRSTNEQIWNKATQHARAAGTQTTTQELDSVHADAVNSIAHEATRLELERSFELERSLEFARLLTKELELERVQRETTKKFLLQEIEEMRIHSQAMAEEIEEMRLRRILRKRDATDRPTPVPQQLGPRVAATQRALQNPGSSVTPAYSVSGKKPLSFLDWESLNRDATDRPTPVPRQLGPMVAATQRALQNPGSSVTS